VVCMGLLAGPLYYNASSTTTVLKCAALSISIVDSRAWMWAELAATSVLSNPPKQRYSRLGTGFMTACVSCISSIAHYSCALRHARTQSLAQQSCTCTHTIATGAVRAGVYLVQQTSISGCRKVVPQLRPMLQLAGWLAAQ
jgi:hypothetical protein